MCCIYVHVLGVGDGLFVPLKEYEELNFWGEVAPLGPPIAPQHNG